MKNKKLLIFSDTHGSIEALKAVFIWAKDRMPPNDSIIASAFLGDCVTDLDYTAKITGFYSDWKIIRGNNDYSYSVPDDMVFEFAGHRFFICHGHRHGLQNGHYRLINSARENDADVVLFGHTHIPCNKKTSGINLINPGSIGRPRSRLGSTFAISECIPGQQLKTKFWRISKFGEISEVKV